MHVDAGWSGRPDRDEPGIAVFGLELQLAPVRKNAGAQIQSVTEPLGCRHGLVRGLAIDMQHLGEVENELRPFLQCHISDRVGRNDSRQSVRPATACREGWPLTAFYMFCRATRPADPLAG